MKNSIGTNVILTLFGESHGPEIGAVLDGIRPGVEISEQMIAAHLAHRKPKDECDTARQEPDNFKIVSGIFNGCTTGAPICITIPNEDIRPEDYTKIQKIARPGHADYAAHVKYQGYEDWRGGGHFSGRLTAAIVAAGAICRKALEEQGIFLATHILRVGNAWDASFTDNDAEALEREMRKIATRQFPVIEADAEARMREEILAAKAANDSVGGIVQTAVIGLPAGFGEPWFDSLEGVLAKALFAIGGVKGVEFGSGFRFAEMRGSQANDAFSVSDTGKISTVTNHNGGINGGISNGMPILFNCAIKPTSSIAQPQDGLNLNSGETADLLLAGRHDPSIVRRICPVISSIAAVALCDSLNCNV